jgi:hypothetical protein
MEAVFWVRKFSDFSGVFRSNSCSFLQKTAGIPPPFPSISGAFLPEPVIFHELSSRLRSFSEVGIIALGKDDSNTLKHIEFFHLIDISNKSNQINIEQEKENVNKHSTNQNTLEYIYSHH